MLSLAIIILALLVAPLLIFAWTTALAARAVGSTRGRFSVGLVAALLVTLIGITSVSAMTMADSLKLPTRAAVTLLALILQICATFVIFKRAFRLSFGRTFAPVGVFVAFSIAQIPLVMLVIRPHVIEAMFLVSGAMSPTVNEGDKFVVNKLLAPRRWDIMAYRNEGTNFCMRLIGLPGETIRFAGGEIEINGSKVEAPPVLAGKCHAAPAGTPSHRAMYRDGQQIKLGDNEYFLIGDNIDRSADSRMYGPSDGASLIGVVDLIYWPTSRFSVIR